jgi:N-acetylneuraminate synthase
VNTETFFKYSDGPKIVAEISANHDGSLGQALDLVHAAAESGADAVKLQTFLPETMTLDTDREEFVIKDPSNIWNGYRLFDLYRKAFTPWEWHEEIFGLANELGMLAFSSAFDKSSIDFLESIGTPFYKVASFECVDVPLIRSIAETGKPMIISTGMASITEISVAVEQAMKSGCSNLTLLKCTSSYPAKNTDSNLRAIPIMSSTFGVPVGLSDHTTGIGAAIGAVALGAVMIEKHIKLEADSNSLDAKFSLSPAEFKRMSSECKNVFESLGSESIGPTSSELSSRTRRRSLYFSKSLSKGDVVTPGHVQSVRPGFGLSTVHLDHVIGMTVSRDCSIGDPVSWEVFK